MYMLAVPHVGQPDLLTLEQKAIASMLHRTEKGYKRIRQLHADLEDLQPRLAEDARRAQTMPLWSRNLWL